MKRTLSITTGKGSVGHNARAFTAENVDAERTKFNRCYSNENIEDVYQKLFGDALERHNNKQKRNDRKIPDYYEKIRTGKQEKLFHEIIAQVGDLKNMSAISENGKLAEQILDEYMIGFKKRNTSLYVFSAYLHMDEATPHLHIDFIPYTTESGRGLDTRVSLKQALKKLVFEGGKRSDTELDQWQDSEREQLAKIMLKHNIEWEKKETHEKHLKVLDYKKKKRTEEVAELDQEIIIKNETVGKLDDKSADLESKIQSREKQAEKIESKIKNLKKQEQDISFNVYEYDEDEYWQLPEPPLLMTAKAYKEQKANPLVEKLKSVIKTLIVQIVQMKDKYNQVVNKSTQLDKQVKRLTSQVEKNKDKIEKYTLIEKSLGKDRFDTLLEGCRNKEPLIQAITKKKKPLER